MAWDPWFTGLRFPLTKSQRDEVSFFGCTSDGNDEIRFPMVEGDHQSPADEGAASRSGNGVTEIT